MRSVALSDRELENSRPGEAVTLAAVAAIMAIGILAVVIYKLFVSKTSTVKLPGGYTFEWK